MINKIEQKITLLSTFPNRANYMSSAAYALDVSIWLQEQANNYPELNTLIEELNTFADEANESMDIITRVEDIVNSNVNYKGDWVAGSYGIGESVTYSDGNDYLSKTDNNTDEPPSTNWKLVPKPITEDYVDTALESKEDADATILKEADIGTKVLAPNGDASQLTNLPSSGAVLLFEKSLFRGL